jgi:hypothetical protein
MAINDWTSKETEPPLTFADAEEILMWWMYNKQNTYKDQEIYGLDHDDISGAFRQVKYNPNVMGMHLCCQCGYGCIQTGATFGDNTPPSDFDPVARARIAISKHAWLSDEHVVEKVKPYLPPIVALPGPTADPPTPFCPADTDELNPGVLDKEGNRLPPPFPMHVDDHLDAEVLEFLERTICASAAGLFDVLGWPDPERVPVPLSMDKLETTYSHKRRMVGRLFDTRRLTTGMLPYKRERLIELLKEWTAKNKFTLKEVAQLLGTLDNHTKYARWARAWYFALSNNVRRSLEARYYALLRIQQRFGARIVEDSARDLPQALEKRLGVIIAREKARYLWLLNVTFSLTHEARECIQILLLYVTSNENPFETNLGLIVKRTPHLQTLGDACTDQGGGAMTSSFGLRSNGRPVCCWVARQSQTIQTLSTSMLLSS